MFFFSFFLKSYYNIRRKTVYRLHLFICLAHLFGALMLNTHILNRNRNATTTLSRNVRCAFRSESLLGAFWIAKNANFHHADNEDSDQHHKNIPI